jgi:hypothetical protein
MIRDVEPLWEAIRKHPAMFLGEASLSIFYGFVSGYDLAIAMQPSVSGEPSPVPRDFHDWVAYRLHFYESGRGWKKMILARAPDEAVALEKCCSCWTIIAPESPGSSLN